MWLPWPYAIAAAVLLGTVGVAARPTHRALRAARPFATETALVLGLYALWRIAGQLSVLHTDGAESRGRSLWRLEQVLHLPSELALQHAVLPHAWLVQVANVYYAVAHVPALIAMLIWLFVRHRDRYPAIRNALALLTGACLLIQLVPVMPPRLLPSLGFVDTGHLYGQSVYTALGHGVSDQLSAMPSLHVGWAVLVAVAVVTAGASRWRWLVIAHPVLTALAVVVTANHWWLDGIVAVALLVAAMAADRATRRRLASRARSGTMVAPRRRARGTGGPMVSVDVRTRTGADVRPVDAATFFGDELPSLMRERVDLAAPGARELGLRPMAFEVDGRSWILDFDGDTFSVASSGEADAVVRLDAEGLGDIVCDLRTPMGFFTGGDLDMPRGGLDAFLDWWVVLRSLLDARPVHTAGSVTFHDRDGAPLDLQRAFHLDDDRDELAHFLAEAGYLHLADVFDEAEMTAVGAEMDAAMDRYAPNDGRSWWARTRDGDDRLVRLQYFNEESPTTRALLDDDRLLALGRITDDGHRLGKPGANRNLVEALVKPIGIVEGISDVPWHKDCSLGSHSYRCCSMTVGISVTGADAESGQLRVVAGSHRALIHPAFVRRRLDLPQVDLPTATGDITIHLSCTLHMSQPPVSRERRVLYTDFRLPDADNSRAPGEAKLKRIREAAPTTVSQPPSPVA